MDFICNMYAESDMHLSVKHRFLTGKELENTVDLLLTDPRYGSRFEQDRTNF